MKPTAASNFFERSPMFDTVELVRDGKVIPLMGAVDLPRAGEPMQLAEHRDPVTILSGIWSLASLVSEGPDEITASYGDRLGELCAEMEAALLDLQLKASVRR